MLETLRKDLIDAAGLVSLLVAFVAAIVAWRAPAIAAALGLRRAASSSQEAERRTQLRAALLSLLALDLLLLVLTLILGSAFLRVWSQTKWDLASLDVVLTAFQTLSVWVFATLAVALAATVAAAARLRFR